MIHKILIYHYKIVKFSANGLDHPVGSRCHFLICLAVHFCIKCRHDKLLTDGFSMNLLLVSLGANIQHNRFYFHLSLSQRDPFSKGQRMCCSSYRKLPIHRSDIKSYQCMPTFDKTKYLITRKYTTLLWVCTSSLRCLSLSVYNCLLH